jgi:hypothetical protein
MFWRWQLSGSGAKYSSQKTEVILRELECILGLLSCKSGLNSCGAHLSESEDLGSVTQSEAKSGLPVFQGGSSVIE